MANCESEIYAGLTDAVLSFFLQKIVSSGDENKDGCLDFNEFTKYLKEHEMKLLLTFRGLDRNNDGRRISVHAFNEPLKAHHATCITFHMVFLFERVLSGHIDATEIQQALLELGMDVSREDAQKILQRFDLLFPALQTSLFSKSVIILSLPMSRFVWFFLNKHI